MEYRVGFDPKHIRFLCPVGIIHQKMSVADLNEAFSFAGGTDYISFNTHRIIDI